MSISAGDVGPIREIVFLFNARAIWSPKLSDVIKIVQTLINAGNSTKSFPHPVSIIGAFAVLKISLFLSISFGPPKSKIFALYLLYISLINLAVFFIDSALGHLSAEPVFIPTISSLLDRLYLLKKSLVNSLCFFANLKNGSYFFQ